MRGWLCHVTCLQDTGCKRCQMSRNAELWNKCMWELELFPILLTTLILILKVIQQSDVRKTCMFYQDSLCWLDVNVVTVKCAFVAGVRVHWQKTPAQRLQKKKTALTENMYVLTIDNIMQKRNKNDSLAKMRYLCLILPMQSLTLHIAFDNIKKNRKIYL